MKSAPSSRTSEPPHSRPGLGAAAVSAAVLCSIACAIILHGAQTRTDAALVVPVALVWAAAALVAGWSSTTRSMWVVIAVALATRLPLLGTPPLLSDDLFRYLWEGAALNAGHNPFTTPPAAIDGLNDALRSRVNHAEVSSIYPPLALWWFRGLAVLGGTVLTAQLATLAVDLGTVAVLAGRRGGPWAGAALVYALHPLPALESAASAHLDVLAIALAAAAVDAHRRGRLGPSFGWAFAGAAVKLLPAAMLIPVARAAGPRRALGWSLVAGLAGLALAWPVLSAGSALLTGMDTYVRHWSFNGFAYPWVEPVLGSAARPALVLVGAAVALWSWQRTTDPLVVWLHVATAFVLLSPTAHPWYVLWALVPSLLLGRWGWSVAAAALLGAYAVLATYDPSTGAWTESAWLWWGTWPPAVGALVAEQWMRRDQPRSDIRPTAP